MAQAPRTPPTVDQPAIVAEVEQTSLAQRGRNPDEVTVRFLKWHAMNGTAYQKLQFAGFPANVAQRLVASGIAIVAETPQMRRDAAERFMTTK